MILPTSLRIGYRDYRVERWPSKTANANDAHGMHDPVNAVIYVSEDRTGWDAVDTLFHEILHAIYTVAGIAGSDDEEHTVSHISPSWVQVWRDNPALRDFFNDQFAVRLLTEQSWREARAALVDAAIQPPTDVGVNREPLPYWQTTAPPDWRLEAS